MSTIQELEQFHTFAANLLNQGDAQYTLEELVELYRSSREYAESNAAIAESLRDLEAGKGRPLNEFMKEFRERHNLSTPDE